MANDWIGILLSNSTSTVDALKGVRRDMADLNASVSDLRAAVAGVAERVADLNGPLNDALENVRAELAKEREERAALATAEDAEDVEQNAALDAALADADKAANDIRVAVDQLNDLAVAPEEANTEAPVAPVTDNVPAEDQAPQQEVVDETPVEQQQ